MKQAQSKPLKTRQEIAEELGVSPKTIYRRLKNDGLELSKNTYLTRAEQELIYKLFEVESE